MKQRLDRDEAIALVYDFMSLFPVPKGLCRKNWIEVLMDIACLSEGTVKKNVTDGREKIGKDAMIRDIKSDRLRYVDAFDVVGGLQSAESARRKIAQRK